jgi:hypothetical protein
MKIVPVARKIAVALLVPVFLSACRSHAGSPAGTADTPARAAPALPMFKRNPEFRSHVKKEPVAEYREKTDNRLNDLYFSVRLYETPVTMRYVAKVEFEGLPGEDTIKLPDMGTEPHPVLQKGKEKYSCIIGLLDNDHQFRELKKVYVTNKGQELKITTLKHYIVTENYHLVGQ